jgi:DNA invertase Pin-like site-specific DNA recombinase
VRVSQTNGRDGDSFASPGEQRDRIRAACERDGLVLLDVIDELDVSGGTPLASRDGLRRAVESVEASEADVIVAAYFDRLVRSPRYRTSLCLASRLQAARSSRWIPGKSRTAAPASG